MQVGDVIAGRYRLVRPLGRGGMGVVFEAYDQALQRPVAVKVLHPPHADDEDFGGRFSREASMLARLASPHILTIYDHGTQGDHMYLVTELIRGGDLRSWLQEHGPMPSFVAVRICEQLADALSDAHDLGVIHRDVKPANVLLKNRRDGLWAYLADFGIAREGSGGLTRTGTVVGSVAYMAPERHRGHGADERSDLYSLGCVLWALLEGEAPYAASTDFQVMEAHVHAPVPSLSDRVVGGALIAPVLDRLLAKDPEERFSSAAEAGSVLSALATRLRIVTGSDGPATVLPEDPHGTVVRNVGTPEPAPAPEPEPPAPRERAPRWRRSRQPAAPAPEAPALPVLPDAPHDTVFRRYAGEPDPGTGTESGTGIDREPAGPGRRRTALVAGAVVAALVIVLGVIGGVLALGSDAEDDPAEVTPTTSPPTTEPPPVDAAPRAPRVTSTPAYRGVRFDVAPVEDASLEVRREGRWTALADPTFTEPTAQGGERACLTFRAVSAGSATPGKPRQACGRAVAPAIDWVRTRLACQTPTGKPCAYVNLDVAGFRSGARLPVSLSTASGEVLCAADCLRPVPIGKDGRGKVDGSLRQDGRPAAFLVSFASGTPVTFVVRVGDASIRVQQPTR